MESKAFGSPQGLAFSTGEKSLFMADYSNGIFLINLATKKITNYLAPLDGTLLGIDGLYSYHGSLIGVQNGVNPPRVVRLWVNPNLSRIERLETLEANNPVFDEPTLGVLVKDTFYFIANSQWGAIDEKGSGLISSTKTADIRPSAFLRASVSSKSLSNKAPQTKGEQP